MRARILDVAEVLEQKSEVSGDRIVGGHVDSGSGHVESKEQFSVQALRAYH